MSTAHLLMIEDDARLAGMVGEYLRQSGYGVAHAGDGESGLALLQDAPVDLVILDLMLPGIVGLEVCRRIRAQPGEGARVPVLMLTAKGDPMDRIIGLELGADDYLPKPFEPRELVARIRAVLRSARPPQAAAPHRVAIGDWRFDRVQRRLYDPQGVMLTLSAAEYRLLVAFVDHPNQALSRDRLLDLTRAPGVDANERSIDLAVSRLRNKLGDSDPNHGVIRTLRGTGYLFAPGRRP